MWGDAQMGGDELEDVYEEVKRLFGGWEGGPMRGTGARRKIGLGSHPCAPS